MACLLPNPHLPSVSSPGDTQEDRKRDNFQRGGGGGRRESLVLHKSFNTLCAEQCCGFGMFLPDPEFYPFRIPDPKTKTKERGKKKLVVKRFFGATNFTKLINYF
jgi:hypothetical protein